MHYTLNGMKLVFAFFAPFAVKKGLTTKDTKNTKDRSTKKAMLVSGKSLIMNPANSASVH